MEPIIPREALLAKILTDLETWIPEFDAQSITTSLAIIEFATRCLAYYETHFARYGLSQGRFTILMFLYHFPEQSWTPAVLAETTGVKRGTMTGLLEVLTKGDWVERRPNPNDGRSSEIHLTRSGRRRLKKLLPNHFARVAQAMQGLSRQDHLAALKQLQTLTTRIASLTADSPASEN